MTLIDGPDCRLNIAISGTGDPVTIFVHGITGSTDELEPLATATAGTRVLLDLRGHGGSESPPDDAGCAGYDHPAMRRDLEAAANHVGATRAVGLSLGAGALLNLLAEQPDRFERIVLVTPASLDGPNLAAAGLFDEMARRLETGSLEDVLAWSLEGSAALVARRPEWGEFIRRRVLRMNATGVPRALRAYAHGRPPVDDASSLCDIPAPALVLANEGDPIHDAVVARRIASLLPNARLKEWPEPLAMFDDPGALATLIAEFIA